MLVNKKVPEDCFTCPIGKRPVPARDFLSGTQEFRYFAYFSAGIDSQVH